MKTLLLALGLTLALLFVAGATATQAADDHPDSPAILDIAPQTDDVDSDNDTRVWVQSWTILAAIGAAGVGLILFMVRVVLGWVKPPPVLDEEGH